MDMMYSKWHLINMYDAWVSGAAAVCMDCTCSSSPAGSGTRAQEP